MEKTHRQPMLLEGTMELIIIIILHCIVASNRIHDQSDDGLEKRPKHVVVPKIRYVNKAPYH